MITGKRYDKLHFSRENIFKSITLSNQWYIIKTVIINFRYAAILKNIYMNNIVCYILNIRNVVSFSAKLHEFVAGRFIFLDRISSFLITFYIKVRSYNHQTTSDNSKIGKSTKLYLLHVLFLLYVISIQQWFLTLTPLDFFCSLMSTEQYLTAILEIPVARPRF